MVDLSYEWPGDCPWPRWLLRPRWSAPPNVRVAFSLRDGGVSVGAYASLNLASHVGDDPLAVAENRRRLRAALALPSEPLWLSQRHGITVVDANRPTQAPANEPAGDAAVTGRAGSVLAVLVADCVPVLLARADGSRVAVAHAGWRGLAAGVLEAAVAALGADAANLHAWLGPAIGAAHFEVGAEVRDAFCQRHAEAAAAFELNARGRWQCDLHRLARQCLVRCGVRDVQAERRCSYGEPGSFYSFRRDGLTGRMAALIWLQP